MSTSDSAYDSAIKTARLARKSGRKSVGTIPTLPPRKSVGTIPTLSPNTGTAVWSTTLSEDMILSGNEIEMTVGELLERIEVLENVILVSESEDLHPIHIKKLAAKIDILKFKIVEKNKLSNDDLFIHPMYILVEQIEHKIKSSNEVTLDQLNELNKIFESL